MRKTLLALLIGATFATPIVASADDSAKDYTFTANVGLTSEYLYRGIAQTGGDPLRCKVVAALSVARATIPSEVHT